MLGEKWIAKFLSLKTSGCIGGRRENKLVYKDDLILDRQGQPVNLGWQGIAIPVYKKETQMGLSESRRAYESKN